MRSNRNIKEAHRLNRFLVQKVDEQLCARPELADWTDPSSLAKLAICFSAKAIRNEPGALDIAHRFCRLISVHKTLFESYDPQWKKHGAPPVREEVTWRYVVGGLLSLALKQAYDAPAVAFKMLNGAYYVLEAWERVSPRSEAQKELFALAEEVFEEVMP